MLKRICRTLMGLSLAASMVLPAPIALAGPADRQGANVDGSGREEARGGYLVKVDHRDRRYDRRYERGDRRAYREDRRYDRRHDRRGDRYAYRDGRRDYRYDDRHRHGRRDDRYDRRYYSDRGYYGGHRHHHHKRKKDNDAAEAALIIGGITLGAIILFNAIDNSQKKRYGY